LLNWNEMDDLAVKTAKVLAADAVEKVGNGHPGTAISLAPAAYLLFQKVMRHDPKDDRWAGRDRFILSVGHSSLTIYNQLFLGGFGLELSDIEALRTWGSKTPGHPEFGHTHGVEITTGPLGQGIASATGFAMSQRFERELLDNDAKKGESVFDHFVYVIAGDGDIQEGVSAESASIAGHLGLGNLVVIYDANKISIEDDTDISFTEDVAMRYRAYGWETIEVDWRNDGEYQEDVHALYAAIEKAKANSDQPTLITLRTIIGWPSPTKQNTGKIHGSKLGAEELAGLKLALGFDQSKSFEVSPDVLQHTRKLVEKGSQERAQWQAKFDAWATANPDSAALFARMQKGELPAELEAALPVFESGVEIATRAASGKVINAIAKVMP
jgi:transketolase